MLGLALSLEGLQQVPLEDETTRRAIEGTVRDRIKYGRIARLDQGDFGEPHFLEGTPFFVLSRPGKLGELRDTHTGALVQTLTGEVKGVTDALYEWNKGALINNQVTLVDSDLPHFLVHYKDAASELRRRSDAGVVVSGRIKSVGSRFRPGDPYFIVRYQDAPSELRRVDKESVSVRLSDQGSWDEPSLSFVPGAPYFLVTYPKAPAELRRTGTGDIVEKLSLKAISPSLFEITFSHDRSYYAITYYTTGVDRAAELRRTDTNRVVTIDRNASTIFFSPISDHFVVGYNDAPGELRRTDSKEIITLSGKVSKAVFNSDDSHFVILYRDVPGEIRRVDSREIIRLSDQIRTVWVDRKGPGFRASYPDDSSVLLHVDGNRLEELPLNTFGPVKARPVYLIARNFVSGAAEIRRADTGEVVLLTGEFAAANSFKYLTDIPYIQIGCSVSPGSYYGCGAFGLIHTLTGKLTSLVSGPVNSNPSIKNLSPKGTLFVVSNDVHADLRRTETAELIVSASSDISFSPDDAYVVTDNSGRPDQLVWTNTKKALELPGEVYDVTFNTTSSLVVLKYMDKPAELRRTATGELLRIVKEVSFSSDGHYLAITYDDDRSELWGEQGGFHRLADLDSGLAGVQFDTSGGRIVVWYEDRHAYLLDLEWLNAMRGASGKLSGNELITIACKPFTDSFLSGLDLKRFVPNAPLQICRSGK